ncbi:MAG: ATP-binding cassette domain-containing protein [Deltaproteobacteria bacterium]|nr:ATP-binding cassette domain-containing protein [Deltaproteobacteria bacterium]
MDTLVEFRDITYINEAGQTVFDRAGFSLFPGERVLVAAPVAAGKSVLLKLLAGFMEPGGGSVRLFGKDISKLDAAGLNAVKKRMGFVFQDAVLVSNLKVMENVALPLLYHTNLSCEASMERAAGLLEAAGFRGDLWGLPDLLPVHARKEVAVARALSLEPELLVFENITAGLTEPEKERISSLILRYLAGKSGRALLLTSTGEAVSAFFRPSRVLRIEGGRFI